MKEFWAIWLEAIIDMNRPLKHDNLILRLILAAASLGGSFLFTMQMFFFDKKIARWGLSKASRWLLQKYYGGIEATGFPAKSNEGRLFVSNHPGVGDSLALFSCLDARDMKIVAKTRAVFTQLPQIRKMLIEVKTGSSNTHVVREILNSLKQGGSVLLYPAGVIEADPARYPDKADEKEWSLLPAYLCQKAEKSGNTFAIQPTCVSSVFPEQMFRNSFVAAGQNRIQQDERAVSFFLAFGRRYNHKIKIHFFSHLSSAQVVASCESRSSINKVIKNAVYRKNSPLQPVQQFSI